jgi:hypothetical protein
MGECSEMRRKGLRGEQGRDRGKDGDIAGQGPGIDGRDRRGREGIFGGLQGREKARDGS